MVTRWDYVVALGRVDARRATTAVTIVIEIIEVAQHVDRTVAIVTEGWVSGWRTGCTCRPQKWWVGGGGDGGECDRILVRTVSAFNQGNGGSVKSGGLATTEVGFEDDAVTFSITIPFSPLLLLQRQ